MARSASKGQGPNGFSNAAEMRNEQHEKRLHESGRRYEVKTRSLNHKERPQTPQRREQRASKCCHLKRGEAETMAAHVQVSESRFLLTSSDSLDTEGADVLVSEEGDDQFYTDMNIFTPTAGQCHVRFWVCL